MEAYNFETPTLQSAKGIAVDFVENSFRLIKNSFSVVLVFFIAYFNELEFLKGYYKLAILAFILIFSSVIIKAVLNYYHFKFCINKDYFILNKGVFKKDEITISKAKIQNIHIKQNFIQQILNVVALNIESAGDDATEIELKAISKSMAIALKGALLHHNHVEVAEFEVIDQVYFKISLKQLILEGISENHLKSLLVILALISGVYDTIRDVLKLSSIESYNFDASDFLKSMLFNISLFVLLLFLAFFYSLIKTLVLNFNLKVVHANSGLEISKGLFNKVSLHVQRNKIQNIRLHTNSLKKYFGLYNLRFSQIMESKKQKEYLAIIALDKLQAHHLIDTFYKGYSDNFNPQRPEKYFINILVIRYCTLILIVNILLILVSPYWLLINIPLLFLSFFHIKLSYIKNNFSINNDYLIKGSGGIMDTDTDYLAINSIQSVAMDQTIFQKRRNLASIVVYSPTNKIIIPHIKVEKARTILNYLLFKIETQDESWM